MAQQQAMEVPLVKSLMHNLPEYAKFAPEEAEAYLDRLVQRDAFSGAALVAMSLHRLFYGFLTLMTMLLYRNTFADGGGLFPGGIRLGKTRTQISKFLVCASARFFVDLGFGREFRHSGQFRLALPERGADVFRGNHAGVGAVGHEDLHARSGGHVVAAVGVDGGAVGPRIEPVSGRGGARRRSTGLGMGAQSSGGGAW